MEAGVAGEFRNWGSGLRRRGVRPGRGALLGSVLLHTAFIASFWAGGLQTQRDLPDFVQYRVKLYSPPPTVKGPPTPVEQTTAAVVTPPRPEPVKQPSEPKTAPRTQAALPKQVEKKASDAKPATGENPKPGAVGGEGIDVDIEGQEFPYPEYLAGIQLALIRHFRWNGAPNLSADVVFYIERDGSAGGIRVVRKSGNFRFDLQAHEAVEQAGRARAFGRLPADWQGDKLLIMNTFAPQR
jgi:outer membrane biosynthesis protein TonB